MAIKKTATLVIGNSSRGHTTTDCDYLCTGSADQTKFTQAMSALPSTGGKIVVLEGDYYFTAPFILSKSCTVIGMNADATKIIRQYNESSISPRSLFYITAPVVSIEKIGFDGNRSAYTSGLNAGIIASYATVNITDCFIQNEVNGIALNSSNYCRISNNLLSGNVNGIQMNESKFCTISGNTAVDCEYGYSVYTNAKFNTLSANTAYNCDRGVQVSGNAKNNTLTGNVCLRGNGASGDYNSTQFTILLATTCSKNVVVGSIVPGKDVTDSGTNNIVANSITTA